MLGRDGGQYDKFDIAVLFYQRLQQREALLRRRDRCIDKEPTLVHCNDRHPNRHVDVEDAKQLLEHPHAPGHRLTHDGLPLTVRCERQREAEAAPNRHPRRRRVRAAAARMWRLRQQQQRRPEGAREEATARHLHHGPLRRRSCQRGDRARQQRAEHQADSEMNLHVPK